MLLSRTAAFAAAAMLLLAGFPSRAQFAFNSGAAPGAAVAGTTAESSAPTPALKKVHGVVQGQQGALPGATVWLHGTRTVVVTNAEGVFELLVPADAPVIELTCGYAGLQDEVVRLAPAEALGSVYLLRPHAIK